MVSLHIPYCYIENHAFKTQLFTVLLPFLLLNLDNFFLKNYLFIYLFIFGCIGSSLLRVGFSLVAASGGYSSLWCTGFSLQWLLLLWSMGSRSVGFSSCGSWALERRLSSCGARAQLLCGMWDHPGPALKPVSPALAGRFLTTAPPGKPMDNFYLYFKIHIRKKKKTLMSGIIFSRKPFLITPLLLLN